MDLNRLLSIDAPSDFTEPLSTEHAAMYADTVVLLLIKGGFEQVAMAPVARRMRQVPSAVKQKAGGRTGFLETVTRRLARRWLRWATLGPGVAAVGSVLPRLPRADDEIHGVRVWSLVREIAAGEARAGRTSLAEIVARADAEERSALLDRCHGPPVERGGGGPRLLPGGRAPRPHDRRGGPDDSPARRPGPRSPGGLAGSFAI